MGKGKLSKPRRVEKAYDHLKFIHSSDARIIRMLAEYLHPQQQFKLKKVMKTIIFFGSARIQSQDYYKNRLEILNTILGEGKRENGEGSLGFKNDYTDNGHRITDNELTIRNRGFDVFAEI